MTSANGKSLRILVADNHPFVLEGLIATIERQRDVTVVAAADGVEGVQKFLEYRPQANLGAKRPTLQGGETLAFLLQSWRQEARVVPTEGRPIRILVVDDHTFMREGLIAFLESQKDMTVVASAGDGLEAVEKFVEYRPDLTVMDLRLPHMSGVDAIASIRRHDPRARTVVLTTYGSGEDVRRAFEAGAMSYLLKEMKGNEVLATLRAVHRGQRSIPPGIAQEIALQITPEDPSPRED